MKNFKSALPRAALMVLIMTILLGVVYTAVVTGIGQLCFSRQANGSIIEVDDKKYGSELLGQQYADDAHMWGRIVPTLDASTYTDKDGNTVVYAGPSNISPASEDYKELVAERVENIKAAHPEKADTPIPVDLVTGSGSGLDPDISYAAAEYQAQRLANNNGMSEEDIQAIIDKCTSHKILGVFGEETVNVLKVNLMLDGILK